MQLLLLTYREELINAKVAKEHYEERLKSEVNFLKSQILGEQQAKESIEDQLTAEMEALREKVCLLESCRTELEAEQVLKHGVTQGGGVGIT
jgi:Rab GTPase-binding effector protein 1